VILGTLLSLIRTEYPNLRIVLLQTDDRNYHPEKMAEIRDFINHREKKNVVFLSPMKPSYGAELYPSMPTENFGYLVTDILMEQLLNATFSRPGAIHSGPIPCDVEPPEEQPLCDYFIFTNGDNLYHRSLFQALLPYMKAHTQGIAFEFTSRYDHRRENEDIVSAYAYYKEAYQDVQIYTKWEREYIDVGTMVISSKYLRDRGTRFCLVLARTRPRSKWKPGMLSGLDGTFAFTMRKQLGNDSAPVVVRRVLMMHQ
jgi:hypothetical protein